MNKKPLVSVLMTAYNREKFIAEAIESVLASTYENWELIIVDDGSKDNTVSISKTYEEKDNRIKVYQNKKNLGDYPNRNKAASYAKGKYLKYLDADDQLYPYSLKIMLEGMEKFPEAALGMEQFFYEELNAPFPILVTPEWVYQTHFLKYGVISVGPSGTIIKASVFKEFSGFSGSRYIGDTELWLRIAGRYPTVFLQPCLVFWRRHEMQEIKFENKDITSQIARYEMNKKIIFSSGDALDIEQRKMALNKLNRRLIVNSLRTLFSNFNVKIFISQYRKSGISLREIWYAIFY